ncbi:MAG: hypothetical protein FH753_02460 [Firmicutes bacterium]|nr:hypothetical protein [Bacillota bacterium]
MLPKKKVEKTNKSLNKRYNIKWITVISLWTFVLAILFSLISENLLRNFNSTFAFIILIFIVLLGVTFDTIGIAVASADEKPFHSMAANKIPEGRYAVKLVRNAGPVSNFCNDVVGDICGIISGGAGTILVLKVVNTYGFKKVTIISVIMSAFIASLTVGGKAFGKEIALKKNEEILYYTSKVLKVLDEKLQINILPDLKKKAKKKDKERE